MGVPTVLVARTDANGAHLLTSDVDERDHAVPHRRAHRRRLLPRPRRPRAAIARGLAYAPYADLIWCETSRAESRRGAQLRRGDPRAVPRQAAGLQLLAVVQLEEEARRRDHRHASSASSARWATSSSSSRWPASMRSTTACSSWPAATASAAWRPTPSCSRREFAAESDGYTRDQAPARGRHRLLRRGGAGDRGRRVVHDGARRLDRGRAVPLNSAH